MEKTEKKKESQANGFRVLSRLKALYDFMSEHGLETLEIDDNEGHVRLVRERPAGSYEVMTAPVAGMPAAGVPVPSAPALPPGAVAIKAPMMGIFYRAASPSSPPYAKEGDKIESGQVLCMVEAMKVFNEIKADYACTILKILVENGKAVKSGQDLFIVQRT